MGTDMGPILPHRALLAAFSLAVLCACSNTHPPIGRWEGVYEDPGLTVAVRLEIAPSGEVRVSAPNAITDEGTLSPANRAELRARLLDGLARAWPQAPTVPLDFDGKAFHKPGGLAHQLEWDAKTRQMTMIYYYSGNRASVRVPLTSVEEFGRDS
jgi:hypothetical protein